MALIMHMYVRLIKSIRAAEQSQRAVCVYVCVLKREKVTRLFFFFYIRQVIIYLMKK